MSSATATIGLTYDGADIQVLEGLYLELREGLDESPTERGVDVTVPGLDGQVPRPRRFHERRLLLSGWVRGSGDTTEERRADYRTTVRVMQQLFPSGGGNAVEPADLVAQLENGATATIPCRCLSIAANNVIPSEFTYISIELLAVEDWVYETPSS